MVRRDKLVRNPVDRLTRPRRKARVPAVPTWESVKKLLRLCDPRERAILGLMAYGGLRRGEVTALDVGDVAPPFGLRRVMGKGGHEVPVALPAPGRAILRDYMTTERAGLPPTAPLFVVMYENRAGQRIERRITGQRIWKLAKAVGARAGLEHCIRTRFAMRVAQSYCVARRTCVSCRNSFGTSTFRRPRVIRDSRNRTFGRR